MEAQTDELIFHLGSLTNAGEYIRHIKRLDKMAAIKDINNTLPEASNALRSWLISMLPSYVTKAEMTRAKVYTILWICGATYGQIAQIFEVKKPTIASSVAGLLSVDMRKDLMATRSKFTSNLSPTTVSAMYEIIRNWSANSDRYMFMTHENAVVIASAVLKEYEARMTEFNEDAPSPYDALISSPESRLSAKE